MSLIEELGGYRKAKEQLNQLQAAPQDAYSWSRFIQANNIKQALLKYRRQHNIFEVGDPVIRKWNNQLYWIISDINNSSEFLIHKNKDARFKDCKVCELPCNLSHANDAEVKEGKRL